MRIWCLTLLVVFVAVAFGQSDSASSKRFDYHTVRGRQPTNISAGRYEGELHFQVHGTNKAKARPQGMSHYGPDWSGNSHLLWDGPVGDSLHVSFELTAAGIYDMTIQFTLAPDYGRFQLSVNNTAKKTDIDCYSTKVELSPKVILKDIPLRAGRQNLVFKLTGGNPRAARFQNTNYLMGLDYLQLDRKDKPKSVPESKSIDSTARPTSAHRELGQPLKQTELSATLKRHCFGCHSGDSVEGKVNLKQWLNADSSIEQIRLTRRIRDAIQRKQMPPKDEEQPSQNIRARIVATLDGRIATFLKENPPNSPIVMRRLNRYEYNNAVRDLLKLKGDIYPLPEKTIRADQPYFDPKSGRFPDTVNVGNRTLGKNQIERQVLTGVSPFAIDLQAEGGFNNRGEDLGVSPILLESFLKLGRSIVNSPEFDGYCRLTESLFNAPKDANIEQQRNVARERLKPFLEHAFRGNVESAVVDRYHRFFVAQFDRTGFFKSAMKQVVAGVLASPRFIYATEFDQLQPPLDGKSPSVGAGTIDALGPYELATRLSLFLWSSIPDEELLAVARDGSLTKPDVLDDQVKRMLEHPRSQALSQNFARQWLRLDQLITAVPDFDRFPEYYSRIGCEQWKFGLQTMIEPLLLFESIMVEDRSIMLLIDADHSWRSDELQSWYDEKVPFGGRENVNRFNTNQQAFRRRTLRDRRQGGVITSTGTLTMTSAPLRTSPIVRGAWVATVIFNDPPPPPPDDVPEIEADDKVIEAKGMTLRERLVQHQVNPSCVSCHTKIDPFGFALENYDAVGRWRDNYTSGLDIDASGKLHGKSEFKNVIGLKDAILDEPKIFFKAFSEHMLSYALGRELDVSDQPVVDEIVAKVNRDHGQFTTIVRSIVQSVPFRFRTATTVDKSSRQEPKQ